jgi:hypothetical protein
MSYWKKIDLYEFQSQSNHDMMQCVTCNKSFLFAPRLKALKNEKKINILVEWEKFPSVLEMRKSNSFLYEIAMWTTLQCNLNWISIEFRFDGSQIYWIEFQFNNGLRFNWIEFKFIKNKWDAKCIQNLLVDMVLEFPFHFIWEWGKQSLFWKCIMIYGT